MKKDTTFNQVAPPAYSFEDHFSNLSIVTDRVLKMNETFIHHESCDNENEV